MNPRFGPLTYGTLLGASLGLAVAAFGLYALREDLVQRSHDSVVLVAFGAAVLGGCPLSRRLRSGVGRP